MKSMELSRQELLWAIETGYIKVKDGKIHVENGKVVFTKSTNQSNDMLRGRGEAVPT